MDRSRRNLARWLVAGALLLPAAGSVGCGEPKPPPYGRETALKMPGRRAQVWAVAPAVNLSGQPEVDPLLQADLAYQQLQQIDKLTVVPVNRVAEVYAGLGIEQVQSPEQAAQVCELLGCDGLVVPTVTAYDPYDPPKFGGSLQLFRRARPEATRKAGRSRGRRGRADAVQARGAQPRAAGRPDLLQAVGMYDAANGSVRDAVVSYAHGRNDPTGPMGAREYFVSMDRYTGFAYYTLLQDLLREIQKDRS